MNEFFRKVGRCLNDYTSTFFFTFSKNLNPSVCLIIKYLTYYIGYINLKKV